MKNVTFVNFKSKKRSNILVALVQVVNNKVSNLFKKPKPPEDKVFLESETPSGPSIMITNQDNVKFYDTYGYKGAISLKTLLSFNDLPANALELTTIEENYNVRKTGRIVHTDFKNKTFAHQVEKSNYNYQSERVTEFGEFTFKVFDPKDPRVYITTPELSVSLLVSVPRFKAILQAANEYNKKQTGKVVDLNRFRNRRQA